jgi:hypothetical protein
MALHSAILIAAQYELFPASASVAVWQAASRRVLTRQTAIRRFSICVNNWLTTHRHAASRIAFARVSADGDPCKSSKGLLRL